MRVRTSLVVLAVGLPPAVAHTLLPAPLDAVLYMTVVLCAVGVLLAGIRRHGPRPAGPWVLVAGGLASFAIGDMVWYVYDLVLHIEPYPSVADLFYLAGYPLLALGLGWLASLRGGSRTDRDTITDAAIVTVGAGVIVWVYLVVPAAADATMTVAGRLIAAAYPVGDLLLLAVFARLLFTDRRPPLAAVLLGIAFLAILVGDVVYHVGVHLGSVPIDLTANALYGVSYVLAAAAAVHPTVVDIGARDLPARGALTRGRLTLLALAALLAPTLLALQTVWDQPISGLVIAVSSGLLFLLVVLRMSGLVSELERRAAEVEQLARSDALTDAMNRRGWDERLAVELARARRDHTRLTIALLDIDHFKDFNDRHGHQAGDTLLRQLADAWTAELRPVDGLARYGGEEFGVVLPGCDMDAAERIVDRLRRVVPGDTTCSAGVAAWEPAMDATSLVARADRALYIAKRSGRDRTEVAPRDHSDAVSTG